jgi:hypothetical protein
MKKKLKSEKEEIDTKPSFPVEESKARQGFTAATPISLSFQLAYAGKLCKCKVEYFFLGEISHSL